MSYDLNVPYDVRQPPERPLITPKAFQPGGLRANPPFAAGKAYYPQRINLAAGQRVQIYQNSLPCQKVTIVNEGGGDLVYGYDGVNLNTPAAGTSANNAFLLIATAGKTIEVDDAIHVWIGSVAGTIASVEVTGLSYPIIPTNPDLVRSPYAAP
jgi:hypothetical protein